jgi:hypothetical protein
MEMSYRAGECYYRLVYREGALLQPIVETFVFLGINLSDDQEDTWYFQDPVSYDRSGPVTESGDEHAAVFSFKAHELENMLDLHTLTEQLIVALKRRYGQA